MNNTPIINVSQIADIVSAVSNNTAVSAHVEKLNAHAVEKYGKEFKTLTTAEVIADAFLMQNRVNQVFTEPETSFIFLGQAGVGKTAVVKQLAEKLGYAYKFISVKNDNIVGYSIPDTSKGVCNVYPDASLFPKNLMMPTVYHLDEFNHADPERQSALYNLLDLRRLGTVKLNQCDIFILTGNLADDNGLGYPIPQPVINRCSLYHIKHDHDMVCDYFNGLMTKGLISPDVVGFMRSNDGSTYFKVGDQDQFSSPRSLERVGKYMLGKTSITHLDRIIIDGMVGCAISDKFNNYMLLKDKLPKAEIILNATKPTDYKIDVEDIMLVYVILYSIFVPRYISLTADDKWKTDVKTQEDLANFCNALHVFIDGHIPDVDFKVAIWQTLADHMSIIRVLSQVDNTEGKSIYAKFLKIAAEINPAIQAANNM